jgi:hypothetical protein
MYEVEGQDYETKIDAKDGTVCGICPDRINQGEEAIGVRHGYSFFYYHRRCRTEQLTKGQGLRQPLTAPCKI